MPKRALNDVRVLWVGDSGTENDHLAVWLRSEGAALSQATVEDAEQALEQGKYDALLFDRPERDAASSDLLARLRQRPGLPKVLVLTSNRDSVREPAEAVVVVPAHPSVVVAALTSLLERRDPERTSLTHEQQIESILQARATVSDLRGLLQLLNSTGPFRYTSVLRFEPDETLTSLWTFDRENPELNGFPENTPVSASYCGRVRDAQAPFVMPDAAQEPSVADHPARHTVLAYCGVPLLRSDGTFFGTLCQFDVTPRFFQPITIKRLTDAAQVLRKHWPALKHD